MVLDIACTIYLTARFFTKILDFMYRPYKYSDSPVSEEDLERFVQIEREFNVRYCFVPRLF